MQKIPKRQPSFFRNRSKRLRCFSCRARSGGRGTPAGTCLLHVAESQDESTSNCGFRKGFGPAVCFIGINLWPFGLCCLWTLSGWTATPAAHPMAFTMVARCGCWSLKCRFHGKLVNSQGHFTQGAQRTIRTSTLPRIYEGAKSAAMAGSLVTSPSIPGCETTYNKRELSLF